jgi:sulfate permease, SulP family
MSRSPVKQSFLERHVPITDWIRRYQWGPWFKLDLIAAVSVAALLVPESMGYAGVAGLPPEVGLYAAPLALLGYAIFGRSTVLVVATSSSTAAVSASVILSVNNGGSSASAVSLSAALALITGVVFVVASVIRLGWVANFMSRTVIEGFIIGLSINIIIGQLDDLLGIDVIGKSAFRELWDAFSQIGDWNTTTAVVGFVSLAVLFTLERFVKKLPAALTVVLLAILYIKLFHPDNVSIVGHIPKGLPSVAVPDFSRGNIAGLVSGALAVALIGFSESYGAASSFARKYGDRLDNNQEFLALGASNLGAGFTSGMVVGGSLSKTAANDSSKAKSQMANVVLAAFVVLTLLFLAPLFENLPEATLAAVVIAALVHSADPRKLAPVWKVNRTEFWLALIVMITVLTLDTLPAIILGVAISLAIVIYRSSFPQTSELGRDHTTGRFESLEHSPDAETIDGMVIYRFDAPLMYANAGAFANEARYLVETADPPVDVLVIDCEEMFSIDFTGAEALEELVEEMQQHGVEVRLARVHHRARGRLERSGVIDKLAGQKLYTRVEDAVAAGPPVRPPVDDLEAVT